MPEADLRVLLGAGLGLAKLAVTQQWWMAWSVLPQCLSAGRQTSNTCPLYNLHPQERSLLLLLICPDNSLLFSWADSCLFALHAKEGEITSFTTPGFPHSPYPNNARCYWALRADANSIISLTFKTLDLEQCTDSSDYIKVYNSLSPVEPHALVR